jgi:D-alanine-D-alanine ligase
VLDKLKQVVPCQDPDLEQRLVDAGRKLFVGLNGSGYGRVDMRVNALGEVFVLEINPNCAILFPLDEITDSSDRILLDHPEGHHGFLQRIFKAALARRQRLRPSWDIRRSHDNGYALHA